MTQQPTDQTRIAIIGAGFGGLGMAYYLKKAGIEGFTIYEKADDLGGTWRENTYPGAACDVPSHLYSFSFEPHFPWSCRYAPHNEIHDYQRHVALKYELMPHIRYGCEVTGAEFDEVRGVWVIRFASGAVQEAEFLVSAVGQLHRPGHPDLPGLNRFKGQVWHSADWNHDYPFYGRKVAVVGTGASAVQFVPRLASQVKQLHLFQRSPGWTIRKVDRTFTPFERRFLDAVPPLHDLDRLRIFLITEVLALAYDGVKWLEKIVTWMAKRNLEKEIQDPALRAKLTPDYPIGCKRILLSNEWLPAIARHNVELVTDAVTGVTEHGVVTADGKEREVDVLVWGTGFRATEFLAPMEVKGIDGKSLRETWKRGASAYMGMSVSGFPNFFVLYGPNTNVGSGSIIYMLERQQRYITQMIQARERMGYRYANLRPEVQQEYENEIRTRSEETTFAGDCQSWYKTADGINTNNWVGSMLEFARRTKTADVTLYETVYETATAAQRDAA